MCVPPLPSEFLPITLCPPLMPSMFLPITPVCASSAFRVSPDHTCALPLCRQGRLGSLPSCLLCRCEPLRCGSVRLSAACRVRARLGAASHRARTTSSTGASHRRRHRRMIPDRRLLTARHTTSTSRRPKRSRATRQSECEGTSSGSTPSPTHGTDGQSAAYSALYYIYIEATNRRPGDQAE